MLLIATIGAIAIACAEEDAGHDRRRSNNYLAVGACLFVLGCSGFSTRRNLILMILSSELMLPGCLAHAGDVRRMHHSA